MTVQTSYTSQDSLAGLINDSSIDSITSIDTEWNITSWNTMRAQISGLQKEEVLGKNLLSVFPQLKEDAEIMEAIESAFNNFPSFLPWAESFQRKYFETHFIPLRNSAGLVVGVLIIMHDVGHRITVERQLQKLNLALENKYEEMQKLNRELTAFTYFTSRDIQSPLSSLYGSLEILVKNDGPNLSNFSKGNLRKMQGSIKKMTLLLDDILTIATISNKHAEQSMVDLKIVLSHVLNNLHEKILEKEAVIEADELPIVKGNPDLLVFLFQSLVDNALKFQVPGRSALVQIFHEHLVQKHNINDSDEYRHYECIAVTDNGIGIDPADHERIFTMFEKINGRQYAGSGIGLTICKKIIESCEGFMQVSSLPGESSSFSCYFPSLQQ